MGLHGREISTFVNEDLPISSDLIIVAIQCSDVQFQLTLLLTLGHLILKLVLFQIEGGREGGELGRGDCGSRIIPFHI